MTASTKMTTVMQCRITTECRSTTESQVAKRNVGRTIFIQQDNAPSHLKLDDPLFCEHAQRDGFDIGIICQPPNSPDFNILDLGFFRAIQYKKNAKTMQDLVPAVQQVVFTHS